MEKNLSIKSLQNLSKILKIIDPKISDELNKINNPISYIEFFKLLKFTESIEIFPYRQNKMAIHELQNPNTKVKFGYELRIDNERWMRFDTSNFTQLFEFYSQYNLSRGHCICSGLGFGLREKWLLSKKQITKITVLEKNIEVIDYHKKINPYFMDKIEVVNCDASEYKGECDTLLLDHYENLPLLNLDEYFKDIKKCCDNIKHKTLWFWPLELVICELIDPKWTVLKNDLNDKNITKKIYERYLNIKTMYPTLPNISEYELDAYCNLFYFSCFFQK